MGQAERGREEVPVWVSRVNARGDRVGKARGRGSGTKGIGQARMAASAGSSTAAAAVDTGDEISIGSHEQIAKFCHVLEGKERCP